MTFRPSRAAGAARILVADSRDDVRSALRLLLEQDMGMVVSGEAASCEGLIEQAKTTCPDVIVFDCDLPGLHTEELLPALQSVCPGVRVVALCARSEARRVALAAGADAFVSKADPPQKLLDAVRMDWGQCPKKVRMPPRDGLEG